MISFVFVFNYVYMVFFPDSAEDNHNNGTAFMWNYEDNYNYLINIIFNLIRFPSYLCCTINRGNTGFGSTYGLQISWFWVRKFANTLSEKDASSEQVL